VREGTGFELVGELGDFVFGVVGWHFGRRRGVSGGEVGAGVVVGG